MLGECPGPRTPPCPPAVRAAVDGLLGAPVVDAQSQPGGWSPGVAARVRCADGRAAFVKAASAQVNAQTRGCTGGEAEVVRALPAAVGSPRLLGAYDDGTWVALVLEDVDGVEPALPRDLAPVLRALDRLVDVPAPRPGAARGEVLRTSSAAWRASRDRGARRPRRRGRSGTSARSSRLEAPWRRRARVRPLLHLDVRTDNVLLRADGEAVLVDWASGAAGEPVLDVVAFLPSAVLQGGGDPDELLLRTAAGRRADPDVGDVPGRGLAGRMAGARPATAAAGPARGAGRSRRRRARRPVGWLRQRTGWA